MERQDSELLLGSVVSTGGQGEGWGVGGGEGEQDNRIQVTVQYWVAFPGVGRGSNWSSYETVYEIIE